jgi:hypothetical protein
MSRCLSKSTRSFEKLVQEYKICQEEASRLESNIWQTAALLGVGSVVGIVTLAGESIRAEARLSATAVVAIFVVVASLVWWRFARRWWSIQDLKFERMRDIEKQIGFRQTILVDERNKEAIARVRFKQENGSRLEKLWYKFWYEVRESPQNYEYRGIQPVARLLVTTSIVLWIFVAVYEAGRGMCTLPGWAGILFWVLVSVILIIVGLCLWRKQ